VSLLREQDGSRLIEIRSTIRYEKALTCLPYAR
jgi:hypothetical protein